MLRQWLVAFLAAIIPSSAFSLGFHTALSAPAARRAAAPAETSLPPELQEFCRDPVRAICLGDEGKRQRGAREEAFNRSPLGKLAHDPEIERMRAGLFPGGKEPKVKSDAWWAEYAKYVHARFHKLGGPAGIFGAEEIEQVHSVLKEIVALPGFAKTLAEGREPWQSDSQTLPERMARTGILASEADFARLEKSLAAEKRPEAFRRLLNAYKEVCEKPGAEDNAVNVNQNWVILCPEKLAKQLYRHQQERRLGPPIVGLIHTLGHELGHSMEFTSERRPYERMLSCLLAHHDRPGSDGARLFRFEFAHYMDEISADYWGAVTLAHELPRYRDRMMEVLRAELDTYCDSPGTKLELERIDPGGAVITDVGAEREAEDSDLGFKETLPTHPKGTYRIEFMGRQPLLRAAIGCPAPAAGEPVGCGLQGETPTARW